MIEYNFKSKRQQQFMNGWSTILIPTVGTDGKYQRKVSAVAAFIETRVANKASILDDIVARTLVVCLIYYLFGIDDLSDIAFFTAYLYTIQICRTRKILAFDKQMLVR
jgi:hypothetical protein